MRPATRKGGDPLVSTLLPTLTLTIFVQVGCGAPIDLPGGEERFSASSALACRHSPCLPAEPGDPPGASYRAEGRAPGPDGHCGAVTVGTFTSKASCEAIPFRPLPQAIFYGNLGAWGSLGVGVKAKPFKTVDEVSRRFGELCAEKRQVSGLGEHLHCHADLIGISPKGWVSATEQVAERLIQEHGATVTIDVRANAMKSMAAIRKEVEWVFSGKTTVVSQDFLRQHPIGLSLDFEPQVVEAWLHGVSAAEVNAICDTHRALMTGYGHDPEQLRCFTYEFGNPQMVWDAERLEPFIFPVLMSAADRYHMIAALEKQGTEPTEELIVEQALGYKSLWIDLMKKQYSSSPVIGCMFADASFLYDSEKDAFTFAEGLAAYGHKCDFYSFQ